MKWVKASDSKPPIAELVIIFIYDIDLYPGCISLASWTGDEWVDIQYDDEYRNDDEYFIFKDWQVTHWMALPDKPILDQC